MARSQMRPEHVNAELRIRGYTHQRIAIELGLSRGTVSTALRTGSSQRVRDFVSALLRCDPKDIWPFRFPPEEDGSVDVKSEAGRIRRYK